MSRILKFGGLVLPVVALTILLLGSCTKNSFKLFDDLDCIIKENFVRIELPITDISPSGGKIKLDTNVYMEVVSYKMGTELGKEYFPLPFTAKIVNAPMGYSLEVIDRALVITSPANHGEDTIAIEIIITSEGVTKTFILTQKPKKYDVGGTIV